MYMGVIVLAHQSCMGLLVVFFSMYNGVIIVCHVDLSLNYKFKFFLAEKYTVGAVLERTAPTNRYYRGGWYYSRPYKSIL